MHMAKESRIVYQLIDRGWPRPAAALPAVAIVTLVSVLVLPKVDVLENDSTKQTLLPMRLWFRSGLLRVKIARR
jgi:hypothetical protein